MPWASKAQARWGHSPAGIKALGKAGVSEFDAATPKGSLKVEKVRHPGALSRAQKRGK